MSAEDGFRKVGHKARNGRHKSSPRPHSPHRSKRPGLSDIRHRRDRKRRIEEQRARELSAEWLT